MSESEDDDDEDEDDDEDDDDDEDELLPQAPLSAVGDANCNKQINMSLIGIVALV